MKKMIAIIAAGAVLTGCVNSAKPDTVISTTGSALEIYSVPALADLNSKRVPDSKLRVVSPVTDAVGKGVAVLAALTGNLNSNYFDKDSYKGSTIDSMPNPMDSYFTPKAKKNISQWMADNTSGYKYEQHLSIGYATWALIYKEATAVPVYQLKYKVIFYKRPEGGTLLSSYTVADCAPTPVEAPLAEWSKDNYAKVTQQTQSYMDSCLLELNNQLPRLLKIADK